MKAFPRALTILWIFFLATFALTVGIVYWPVKSDPILLLYPAFLIIAAGTATMGWAIKTWWWPLQKDFPIPVPVGPELLKGIDSLPWHRLRHLRGKATDVPQFLRDFASDDREVARKAIAGGLWDRLSHQGTHYQASPFVIPFLLQMLRDGHLKEESTREEILQYLLNCRSNADAGVSREYRPRLLAGREVYRQYCGDENARVSRDAAKLLEWCGTS